MQIVGVIDLRRGIAVHARGGRREEYQPVARAGAVKIDGDAEALARFYLHTCGLTNLYVADLDAIAGEAAQHEVVGELAALGATVWLDAAIDSVADARDSLNAGASHVIVGLETLPDFGVLGAISTAVGRSRVAFSLDLDNGRPRLVANSPPCHSVELLAATAVQAGVDSMIVLDLARVGTGAGIDVERLSRIASRVPQCRIYAGGGVASASELRRLDEAGVDGALVATALLEGHITPDDVRGVGSAARRNTAR